MEEDPAAVENKIKIMIADDDPDELFLVKMAFQEIGFTGELQFAQNGEELLKCLSGTDKPVKSGSPPLPAIILLDLNMPVMNGWQALKKIKNNPELISVPVIIWTTSDADRDKRRCMEIGADSFISKSENYAGLIKDLRALIEKYGLISGSWKSS